MTSQQIPPTMRAWTYKKVSSTLDKAMVLDNNFKTFPYPSKASKTILVEVVAASLNPVDYKIPEIGFISTFMVSRPAIPGADFAGYVRLPAGTTEDGFKDGDRVFGTVPPMTRFGSLAQYIVCPLASVARLPDSISFNDGSCLGVVGMTAYQSLAPFIKPGQTVFVNGASGGVGTLTIQIAKALDAHVVASCSGANVQLVRDLGADEVIDYRSTDLIAELKKRGPVFDHLVDNVGNNFPLHKACDVILKPGGRMVQVGGGPGSLTQMISSSLLPAFLGGARTPWEFLACKPNRPEMDKLAGWIVAGKLKIITDSVVPFDQAPKGYEKVKTSRARGKVVVSNEQ